MPTLLMVNGLKPYHSQARLMAIITTRMLVCHRMAQFFISTPMKMEATFLSQILSMANGVNRSRLRG